MNPEVSMSVDECWKILKRVQARYRQASRRACSRMLDEPQAITLPVIPQDNVPGRGKKPSRDRAENRV